jgi:hypothetical protein
MNYIIKSRRNLAGPVADPLSTFTSSYSKKKGAVAAIAITALMSMTALIFPFKILANSDDVRTFTVDVAFGNTYFQNNVNPAIGLQDISPGDTFIQDGNIYPAGTIPRGKTNFDPNTPGAIGKYRARATWTINGADFQRAAAGDKRASPDMAFGTEMYSLLDGKSILMAEGALPNAYFSADRVLLGGTGSFRDAVGEVHEENIGENKIGFCNLRVTFVLRSR